VQWVPYELAGTTWEAEESKYVEKLLGICERFAPGEPRLGAGVRHLVDGLDRIENET
jgi:hypothetical protein